PLRELVRSVEGLSGTVPMRWRCSPRFDYGRGRAACQWRAGAPVASCQGEAVAVPSWGAGQPSWEGDSIVGAFDAQEGHRAMLALVSAYAEPLVFPNPHAVARRLGGTIEFWRRWVDERGYSGPWRDAVVRSALALKALIFSPSGATVAAPTTSLPEEIGGQRNWDYRYCWIRDSNFIIEALIGLGCYAEAQSLFWWFMHATALTEPQLH